MKEIDTRSMDEEELAIQIGVVRYFSVFIALLTAVIRFFEPS